MNIWIDSSCGGLGGCRDHGFEPLELSVIGYRNHDWAATAFSLRQCYRQREYVQEHILAWNNREAISARSDVSEQADAGRRFKAG
jgi:hypothetical protein